MSGIDSVEVLAVHPARSAGVVLAVWRDCVLVLTENGVSWAGMYCEAWSTNDKHLECGSECLRIPRRSWLGSPDYNYSPWAEAQHWLALVAEMYAGAGSQPETVFEAALSGIEAKALLRAVWENNRA